MRTAVSYEPPGALGFGMLICAPAIEAAPNNVTATETLERFHETPLRDQ